MHRAQDAKEESNKQIQSQMGGKHVWAELVKDGAE